MVINASIELPGKALLLLPTARGRSFNNEWGFLSVSHEVRISWCPSPSTLMSTRQETRSGNGFPGSFPDHSHFSTLDDFRLCKPLKNLTGFHALPSRRVRPTVDSSSPSDSPPTLSPTQDQTTKPRDISKMRKKERKTTYGPLCQVSVNLLATL